MKIDLKRAGGHERWSANSTLCPGSRLRFQLVQCTGRFKTMFRLADGKRNSVLRHAASVISHYSEPCGFGTPRQPLRGCLTPPMDSCVSSSLPHARDRAKRVKQAARARRRRLARRTSTDIYWQWRCNMAASTCSPCVWALSNQSKPLSYTFLRPAEGRFSWPSSLPWPKESLELSCWLRCSAEWC